ncbi:2-oxoacid:acceptor oxidoreductase family protein [bacterium]|nr:2-oxoacid:acceptor oxidoreductase family protein [candidate division CSSED10-310 bacterium]
MTMNAKYDVFLEKPKSFYANYPRKTGNIEITHYCPGCGHGIIHKYIAEALDKLEVQDKTILVSPVGCSVFAYYYFDTGNIQAAHGRAPAVATGVKRSHPDSIVISYQGDGDLAAIGTAEIIHAANRGENISVFFVNNAIYGMTGGQMAPTTLEGQKTTTSPYGRNPGNEGFPIRVAELLATLKAPVYIERVSLHDTANRSKARKAIFKALKNQKENRGFSFVEILSQCPTGWKVDAPTSYTWIKENMVPYFEPGVKLDRSEEAPPITFPERKWDTASIIQNLGLVNLDIKARADRSAILEHHRNPRIKIAGFGGQGVLTLGILISGCGMMEDYNVAWLPSYGPEMRGGTAHCHVTVSDSQIGSPLVTQSTVCIAMNKPSQVKFEQELVPGGLLIRNSSMIDIPSSRNDIDILSVPASEIATGLGSLKVANMVVLGAYLERTGLIAFDTLDIVLKSMLKKASLLELNSRAIAAGREIARNQA